MIAIKNLSKGISIFLKTAIFVISILYVFYKIEKISSVVSFSEFTNRATTHFFIIALFLVFVNWGLEAVKWKYLIKAIEFISLNTAIKSVLSGVSISIFSPNRVGDFIGKVFYLKTAEKSKATVVSFIGSGIQLSVTLLAGIIAIGVYYKTHHQTLLFLRLINSTTLSLSFLLLLFFLVITFIYLQRSGWRRKIQTLFPKYSVKELFYVFVLSATRYAVFSFQYYIILLLFNVDIGMLNSFLLIAFTFFASSIIPSFALSELAVRSATSLFFFSSATTNTTAIIAASIVMWLINLALPALVGTVFIWQLNFFEEE